MPLKPSQVNSDLACLYPPFAARIADVLKMANEYSAGKFASFSHWKVFEMHRSVERQAWLYAQGRTRPGARVTNAKSPKFHGFGLAADFVWVDTKGRLHWDGPVRLWAILGHCARAHGLVWGGDWESFTDKPHVQCSPQQDKEWRAAARKFCRDRGLSTP